MFHTMHTGIGSRLLLILNTGVENGWITHCVKCIITVYIHKYRVYWLQESLLTWCSLTTCLLLTAGNCFSDLDLTFLVTAKGWLCWTGHGTAGDMQCVFLTYTLLTAFCPCCIGLRTQCILYNYGRKCGIISYYWSFSISCKKGLALQTNNLPLPIFHLPADRFLSGEKYRA